MKHLKHILLTFSLLNSWALQAGASYRGKDDLKSEKSLKPLPGIWGAAERGDLEALACCSLEHINTKSDHRPTPLYYAINNLHVDAVQFLLEHGADAQETLSYKRTFLHGIARQSTWTSLTPKEKESVSAIAALLIAYGVDPDAKEECEGKTPRDFAPEFIKQAEKEVYV